MLNQEEEVWRTIEEFPNYEVSNFGRIYNVRQRMEMRTSETNFGHIKITLLSDHQGRRYTRSVAQLVAEAFVRRPNDMCDQVVLLDGDLTNVAANNMVWRPRWFAWKYTRQLKTLQPIYYQNLPITNTTTGNDYTSVIEAGIREGLLFEDIWRSTYTGARLFPHGYVFEVRERV